MPNAPHTWGMDDDWSGITNATERRKRQNRLGQRAYRQRKHFQKFIKHDPTAAEQLGVTSGDQAQCQDDLSRNKPVAPRLGRRRGVPQQVISCRDSNQAFVLMICNDRAAEFAQRFLPDFRLCAQQLSDLSTVVHLNILNALYSNGLAVGVTYYDMTHDDGISPFNKYGPEDPRVAADATSPPGNLLPTEMQKAVVHHPWLDLIPFASMRDSIIRAAQANLLDEDELCDALYGLAGDDELTSFVVWGAAWDKENWELSTGFLKTWGWLLGDCPDVLEATNCWRERRGEAKINNTGYIEEL
ncbi:hypothetical protein H072_5852 [Dactylellina haptotyla CBS 200.50]|uniref:BZIP domain-containing protein n=1 Tax=Dactylellina haptotyla (strain CBS 200.50) TaxID=1284197 RepID=S8BLR8_DACHA|nr:hypothetical protein H072_5852 [Dactylellina haptotyla CBS 200.50]